MTSNTDTNTTPYINRRGIRQHINFPMDISSYPLEEAKEYIHSLAQMGINFLTFHSYPEQWYEYKKDGKQYYAGNYFYSEPHEIFSHSPYFESTRNQHYFMIPEHEPCFDQKELLSKQAIHWLNEVMQEAKLCGMEIRMSIELRGGDVDENVITCEEVLRQYPLIDCLELITQECGGWGADNWEKDEIWPNLLQLFGNFAEEEEFAPFIKDGMWQLPLTAKELKVNLDVIQKLREKNFPVSLASGIYATDPDTLNVTLLLMRKLLPSDVGMAFLSAHGAQAVADSLEQMLLTPEDLSRSTIYSWAEFDGNMYLQQSEIYGLNSCIDVLDKKCSGSLYAVAVNHWRTSENLLTLNYFAKRTTKKYSPEEFLKEWGQHAGIADTEQLCKAVDALEKATSHARYHLGNIGFCYRDCWMLGDGLGYVGNWEKEQINKGIELYACAEQEFSKLSCENDLIKLLNNRIGCSILHLSAMLHLSELKELWKHPDVKGYKESVEQCCAAADYFEKAYVKLHCEIMPDRGCVGTIVSYDHAMPAIFAHLKKRMLGYVQTKTQGTANDAPPSPAI